MNNTVTLRVSGREWGGWTTVKIAAGIERLARDFNVQITRQWPGESGSVPLAPRVKKGDAVEVLIGDDLVISGWVEATPVRYDARGISFGLTGRSKTADLIDCTAAPTQFSGRTLAQIATQLAKPFGVSVVDAGAPKTALQGVQADHGETVNEVLNKLLGQQQALAYDDPQGRLVVGAIGTTHATTALVLGENVLRCDTEQSIRDRFSDYQVAGQRAGGDDDFGEATISAIRATAKDSGVTRYRPHYLQQTGNATGSTCQLRCQFEARQRAARTDEATYTVQGWRQGDGSLWQPNQRVIVFDPLLDFNNREMVIAEVTYSQDEGGMVTELRVGPEDAYLPEPEKPGKRKKAKKQDEDDF
ncbi:phage baseplate assembly protein [Serratia quinivorans]|uniref:phage baseplate assembly protein n=1 Tax=Serratia quinivorans TaxID=137545 RepID=UPI0039825BD5